MHYYEYPDYKDAVSRGVGLCSQHALAVADYMRKLGFKSTAMGLHGHVVDETIFPNKKTYILDADYNVFMPFGLAYAKTHKNIVRNYYLQAGYSKKTADNVSTIYTHNSQPYRVKYPILTHVTKALGWGLPLILILIGIMLLVSDSRPSEKK